VIATVSSEQKAEFVKRLGADEAVIYTQDGFADAVNDLTGGKGADLVFDTVGGAVFKRKYRRNRPFWSIGHLAGSGRIEPERGKNA